MFDSIKKKLEQVSSMFSDEKKSEGSSLLSVINTELETISAESTSNADKLEEKEKELKRVIKESIGRKNENKNLTQEIESLTEKYKDYDNLKKYHDDSIKNRRVNVKTEITEISKHERFPKIQDQLVFPDKKDKDGKIDFNSMTDEDWAKISDEDMEKNISVLDNLVKIDYFGEIKIQPSNSTRQRIQGEQTTTVETPEKIEVKTPEDLKRLAHEIAKDYK